MRQLMLLIAVLMLCGCNPATSIRNLFSGAPSLDSNDPNSPDYSWSEPLDLLFAWGNAASVVIIVACIGILIWVQIPSLKKWAWVGITSALTMLAMGITFAVIKPYIPFIVMGMLAFGIGLLLFYLIINWDTLKQYVKKDEPDLTPSAQKLIEICKTEPISKTNN